MCVYVVVISSAVFEKEGQDDVYHVANDPRSFQPYVALIVACWLCFFTLSVVQMRYQ